MPRMRKIVGVTVVAAGVVLPTAAVLPAEAEAAGTPAFVAYHAASAGRQAAYARTLKRQGYRPITVNVADGGRYAAVWIKGGGPAWAIYQGMSGTGYQRRFNEYVKKGYQPISVSATGSGGGAVFAAVFEKKSGKFFAKHGLTATQFASVNQKAASTGYTLTSVDVYGSAASPRYVGVWTANSGGSWYYTYGKTAKQHEAEFAKRMKQGFRPTQVAVGPDGTYSAAWRKDGLRSWAHYIEMSSSGYQKRFDQQRARGLHPVQVNSENGRYAAIFVKT
ncbi:hypothetical protein ACTWPT_12800 [Nonomuraea sp. 3N208]|uniref:hypothetical protein n=1 Tax=Nonomuraea sp. 3N208 TaxID=3457421 RepID=UPI003FCD92F9